jgi:putative ABC transport system substrate-binding protein
MIRRRDLMTMLAGAAAGWPAESRAQQPAMPVIGFLRLSSPTDSIDLVRAFRQGLNDAGFIEGRNVSVEYRWAEGRGDRLAELAADLVRRRVAVIVGHSSAAHAAKAASPTIPIIFIVGNDPVRTGLVPNFNRPGGNVTGVTFTTQDVTAKRFALLHELVPKATVIGVLNDPTLPEFEVGLGQAMEAGKTHGVRVVAVDAVTPDEFYDGFATLARAGAAALLVNGGAAMTAQRQRLAVLSARHAIPASFPEREFVLAGGLMSYGPSQAEAYRRGGVYAARILKGEKAGDLPVEQPTRFQLVINRGTARMLDLDIPAKLLAIADEVIE